MRLFFLTPSLIGSINDRIFILTNRQVVLMGLSFVYTLLHLSCGKLQCSNFHRFITTALRYCIFNFKCSELREALVVVYKTINGNAAALQWSTKELYVDVAVPLLEELFFHATQILYYLHLSLMPLFYLFCRF